MAHCCFSSTECKVTFLVKRSQMLKKGHDFSSVNRGWLKVGQGVGVGWGAGSWS